jgi:hypothetical protein
MKSLAKTNPCGSLDPGGNESRTIHPAALIPEASAVIPSSVPRFLTVDPVRANPRYAVRGIASSSPMMVVF